LAFGYFNGFWWFFCFKNSGFVFNERVKLYFYDKRVASPFSWIFFGSIVGSNLQANANNANNANNAVNTDNTNNEQININSQNLNILSSQDTNNTKSNTKHKNLNVSYTVYGTNSGGLSNLICRV
jgi:hypothetical protein